MRTTFEKYSWLQTFLITSISFLIIVVLIEFLYSLTHLSYEEAITGLGNPKYMIRKAVGAVIYALIMTFYFKRKRKN